MERFFRNKPLIVTVIAIIILFVLLVATAGGGSSSGAQSAVGGIFVPVQKFFYQATDNISSFFDRAFANSDLTKENAELKTQISELKSELSDYDELKKENERLQELLDFQDARTSRVDDAGVLFFQTFQYRSRFAMRTDDHRFTA